MAPHPDQRPAYWVGYLSASLSNVICRLEQGDNEGALEHAKRSRDVYELAFDGEAKLDA